MGKKGGSGSGSTKIQVPSGIGQNSVSLSQLGAYGAGYLPALTSMANWASAIATGGNTTQANPFNEIGAGSAPLANKTVGYTTNLGAALSQESQTFGGSGGSGVIGSGGSTTSTGGTTAAGGGFPASAQQFPTIMGAGLSPGGYLGTPVNGDTPFYDQNTQQFIGVIQNGKFVPSASSGGTFPQMYQGSAANTQPAQQNPPSAGGGSSGSILGPFLQNAWDAIQAEGAGANQLGGEGTQLFNEGQGMIAPANATIEQGNQMVNQATTGTGLYPSQQAFVDQATKSQQAAIQQQMASEGLTSSTQNAQLQGQAAQQGAATAGALIQGNIAAGQAQIGLGDQQLSLAENWSQLGVATQQAAISAITTMASQSAGLQAQAWSQAMQGYGMIGQFLQTSMAGFGESNQGLGEELQASETQAQINAGVAAQQAQASSSGMSSLLGGVGQLLGGGQGGSGGLIGSLGGLLGGAGGGIAAGGAATAAGASAIGAIGGAAGAAGGAGAGISAAATAIGAALSCIVAREVYGSFDGTWKRFREWMMFDAPDRVRMFYVKHAFGVAKWLRVNPDWKPFFKFYMDMVLE